MSADSPVIAKIQRKFRAISGGLFNLKGKKVFAIGLNKTATSSLHALFLECGLDAFHGDYWRDFKANSLIINGYQAFSDGPPKNFIHLCEEFPDSHFILPVRDLEPWLLSRLGHIKRRKAAGMHRTESYTWNDSLPAIEHWIRDRTFYHARVLEYFTHSRTKLLTVDLIRNPDESDMILDFIGLKSESKLPWKNKVASKTEVPAEHREMIEAAYKNLGISAEERHLNILSPSLLTGEQRRTLAADTGQMASRII